MRLILFICLFSFGSFAQPIAPSNTKGDVQYIHESFKKIGFVNDELRGRFPINKIKGTEYVSFLVKKSSGFNAEQLRSDGILVGGSSKDIVSIKYPLERVNEILNESHFSYVHLAGKVKPSLHKVPIGTRADSVWWGIGLPESYTGKDVIIGITDWGFDYSHPMFYDTLLQNTRILAAWDQFKNSGPAPAGYNYGTEFSTLAEYQAVGADTANIYSYATHGSHVAGIAGGSGAGTQYRGIAFESEFLFTTFLVDESAVLDAWQWMYDKATAEGKRLVINMSWGLYHMDAIDGTALISQALDNFSDLGVLFVTSAGNNGNVNFHIDKDYNGSDTLKTRVQFYSNPSLATLWGQSIHMWGEPGNPFNSTLRVLDGSNNIVVESPWYSTPTAPAYIDSFLVASGTDTIFFNLATDAVYPTNNRPQMRLRVKYPPTGYKIVLASTANSGKVHYWNVTELTNDVGNWGSNFLTISQDYTGGDDNYGIGTPACTNSAVSVGAYSSEFFTPSGTEVGGAGSSFTSIGPLMTDSMKPDVSAPGVLVVSSISSYTDANYNQVASVDFGGRTYPFAGFSGTSMSSPATAGVAALILDANPYLSAHQVKSILIATARTDSYTGPIPPHNTQWGWGKVNAYAAVQLALNTTGLENLSTELNWNIYPNPTSNNLKIDGVLQEHLNSVQVLDLQGKIVYEGNELELNVQPLNAGTYILRLIQNGKVEQRKFVKQ